MNIQIAFKQAASDIEALAANAIGEAQDHLEILALCLGSANLEGTKARLAAMPSFVRDQAMAYLPAAIIK